MEYKVQLFILFSLLANIAFCHEEAVTFYEHANHKGDSITVNALSGCPFCKIGLYHAMSCRNLPKEWWDRASSINTYGHKCIVVYSRENCRTKGSPIRFYGDGHTRPDRIPHHNFGGTWFNDNARSYMICR